MTSEGHEDEDPFAPRLPADRPWVHPSELGPGAALRPEDPRPSSPYPTRGSRSWLVGILGALAGAAITLTAVVGLGGFRKAPPPQAATSKEQVFVNSNPEAPVAIAEKVVPSVARIDVTSLRGAETGTAVIWRSNNEAGWLITTADLIDGAESIMVTIGDGPSVAAQFVGSDRESDIAVVKVDAGYLPTIVAGRPASNLQLGEPVIAVESSSLSASTRGARNVPVGLINGLGQRLESDDSRKTLYGMIKTNLLLTSAATGAPLIDASNGAVIGIITSRGYRAPDADTQIASQRSGTTSSSSEEIAPVRFATPIDYATSVANSLTLYGRVPRAWLGVTGDALTDDEAQRLEVQGGLKILSIDEGSPARAAGLEVGDVLLSMDKAPITSRDDLQIALRQHRPDDFVSMFYLRNGERQPTYTTLVERNPNG